MNAARGVTVELAFRVDNSVRAGHGRVCPPIRPSASGLARAEAIMQSIFERTAKNLASFYPHPLYPLYSLRILLTNYERCPSPPPAPLYSGRLWKKLHRWHRNGRDYIDFISASTTAKRD